MKNKYFNFILSDSAFTARLTVLILILFTVSWQFLTLNSQNGQLSAVKSENERLALTPPAPAPKVQPKEVVAPRISKNYTLEGTTIKNGSFIALIDGIVYSKGDKIDDFTVEEITMRSSTLKNAITQEVQMLKFAESEFETNNGVITSK